MRESFYEFVWTCFINIKIRCSEHCLNDILPPVLSQCYDVRHPAHSFVLPQCNSNLYKKSFITYCLFKDV